MKFKLRRNFFVDKPKVFSLFFYFPKKVFPPKNKRIFLFSALKSQLRILNFSAQTALFFLVQNGNEGKLTEKSFLAEISACFFLYVSVNYCRRGS